MTNIFSTSFSTKIAVTAAIALVFSAMGYVLAGHNGAVVSSEVAACEPTVLSAAIADPDGTHKVANMWLVVDDGDSVQTDVIPTNGDTVDISVGPFGADTDVSWRVFGGGERSYDQPLWNGFGGATFSADVTAYGVANGFGWVVGGVDDPNPFTTWNEVNVPGCSPEVKDDCKNGGWESFGFSNQGQCIRFVNTGQDSR